jgi:hypothetical protein
LQHHNREQKFAACVALTSKSEIPGETYWRVERSAENAKKMSASGL